MAFHEEAFVHDLFLQQQNIVQRLHEIIAFSAVQPVQSRERLSGRL
jgi:hypothetical protein